MSDYRTGLIPELFGDINDLIDQVNNLKATDSTFDIAKSLSDLKHKIRVEFIGS
tara:strand:- start:1050 stop:1211 length:162 start_codon:yes stop_codon:yes gene_type:complete